MDFEQIYKLKIKRYKEPIFFVAFTILLVWNIRKAVGYFGCFKLSKDVCQTAYLYLPSNNYHNVGSLEFYILIGLALLGFHSVYHYFTTGKLQWYKLLLWGLTLLFLKYFITATTLY